MDSEAGEAASSLHSIPHRRTRKRTPLLRLYRLLVSRLSTPLLTSLILLPTLPPNNRHILFELVPFYKSLRCLVLTPAYASSTPAYRKSVQQWLSYWTVYTLVRFLEATRCNVSTGSQRREALQYALDRLPRALGGRILRLLSFSSGKSNTTATSTTSLQRDMTLATQLAGSSTRWTIIKAILLFYAMDEELQGARRIMQKIIKPFFAFFTSLDEEDYDVVEQQVPRRLSDEEDEQVISRSIGSLKLNLGEKQDEKAQEDERNHTPSTPELSMDESCGGSDDECYVETMTGMQATIIIKQDMEGNSHSATWPLETRLIAVESHDNHWVR